MKKLKNKKTGTTVTLKKKKTTKPNDKNRRRLA